MLSSFEELEQDIEKFKNNVMASSELIERLNDITDVIKKQTIAVNQQTEANEAYLKECSDELERRQQEYISQLEKTKTELEDCKFQIDSTYKGFLQKIQETDLYGIKKSVIDMKQDVSKKINILIGITAIAVIVAIVGIFI